MQYIEWAMWTVGIIMDVNACMDHHGIEWKPAKEKLRKEIM